jgi:hypothetical protein
MPQTPEERRAASREHSRAWRARNPEKVREQYERTREYQREYQQAWRARNPEKVREIQRRNREKNRDKNNEQRRAWRERNPDREREQQRAYRAQHPWRQHKQFSAGDYAATWEAQAGRCYLCGEEMPNPKTVRVDHDYSCCPRNASCPTCRRGLVHHQCNIMIGLAHEDPAQLRRAADALEAAQLAVAQRKAAQEAQLSILSDL